MVVSQLPIIQGVWILVISDTPEVVGGGWEATCQPSGRVVGHFDNGTMPDDPGIQTKYRPPKNI